MRKDMIETYCMLIEEKGKINGIYVYINHSEKIIGKSQEGDNDGKVKTQDVL